MTNENKFVKRVSQYNAGLTFFLRHYYREAFCCFREAADLGYSPAKFYVDWITENCAEQAA